MSGAWPSTAYPPARPRPRPWLTTTTKLPAGENDLAVWLPQGATLRQIVGLEVLAGALTAIRLIPDTTAIRATVTQDTILRFLVDLEVSP